MKLLQNLGPHSRNRKKPREKYWPSYVRDKLTNSWWVTLLRESGTQTVSIH